MDANYFTTPQPPSTTQPIQPPAPRPQPQSKGIVRLISLGGAGNVTKNMYVYEYRRDPKVISDILIVDCGMGFPDEAMFGVDLVIPDISYLRDKQDKIRAIFLTHGHEDHIGALPYLLPELPRIPIYATRLTAGFVEAKLKEYGIQTNIYTVTTKDKIRLGPFTVEPVHVTHSIPDASNLVIRTPIGIFYHGCDYKFDWTPIDGRQTDVAKIALTSAEGILCLLSDCVRVESPGYTLSEQIIEDTLEKEMRECVGKFIFTTQSSNISRIQQAVNVAIRNNRRIAFLGRSLAQNLEVAKRLGYIEYPDMLVIKDTEIRKYKPSEVALIVTGSQAQPNSVLTRLAQGIHKFSSISTGDVVVFSADPIPGNENAVHALIDTISLAGAKVAYSDIVDELHVSGHGAANDLALMIGLTRAKYLWPIGGTIRQVRHYSQMAQKMGYKANQMIMPGNGQVMIFDEHKNVRKGETIELRNVMIDGLGVGDIGNVVLRDRQTMANEGMVVVIVPIEQSTGAVTAEPDIISRGFVYMKEATGLMDDAKQIVKESIQMKKGLITDWKFIRKQIEGNLEEFLYNETHRRPLILAVVVEV